MPRSCTPEEVIARAGPARRWLESDGSWFVPPGPGIGTANHAPPTPWPRALGGRVWRVPVERFAVGGALGRPVRPTDGPGLPDGPVIAEGLTHRPVPGPTDPMTLGAASPAGRSGGQSPSGPGPK